MGNKITNWAKRMTVGNAVAKAILLCLSDEAFDDDRGFVSMTQSQIADVVEVVPRSVIRALDFLENEKKLIRRLKSKTATGQNNPNRYQILCSKDVNYVSKYKYVSK